MRNGKVRELTYMSLLAALAIVATMIIRIPVPATQGYIHLGDTILILAVLILGVKKGAAAGAIGQAIADLIGGYAIFAPVTFVAKILMGILIGVAIEKAFRYKETKIFGNAVIGVIFVVLSGVAMIGTYFVAEAFMYGGIAVPLVEIPANIIQFASGVVLAGAVGALLLKSPAKTMIRKR